MIFVTSNLAGSRPGHHFTNININILLTLTLTSINFSPVWTSNYIYNKLWVNITYTFPNVNGATLKFGNEKVISSHTLLGKWLLNHVGNKAIRIGKYGPSNSVFIRVVVQVVVSSSSLMTLQWRHNGCDCVSNHQPHNCLLNRLFGRRSK